MKTPEQIIESYMSFNPDTGRTNGRPLKVWILSAMEEYAREYSRMAINNLKNDFEQDKLDRKDNGYPDGGDMKFVPLSDDQKYWFDIFNRNTLPKMEWDNSDLKQKLAEAQDNYHKFYKKWWDDSQYFPPLVLKAEAERDKYMKESATYQARKDTLEEWLTEYRDELKRTNVYHKNQALINKINDLLNWRE